MHKRLIALLLVIALTISACPTVFAAETEITAEAPCIGKDALSNAVSGSAELQSNNNGTNDYRKWAQADSRWGSLPLGTSSATVASAGCLATSVTKLAIQCGLKSASTFNVATFVNWMNGNGGFDSNGWLQYYPAATCTGMTYRGCLMGTTSYISYYSASAYNSQILSWINQGYHMVIQVNGGGHWIAVDEAQSLATGTVYIMDTGLDMDNVNVTLASRYSQFNRIMAYSGGTTPSTTVTVTFNANGGSCDTGSQSVTSGTAIGTLPNATREGYEFLGWYTSPDTSGINPINAATTITSPTTLYAHWGNIVYSGSRISFDCGDAVVPEAAAVQPITVTNGARLDNDLVLYTAEGHTVGTNIYGAEVAVDSTGRVTAKRALYEETLLTVPEGGFVLSGHYSGAGNSGPFVGDIQIGDYVAFGSLDGQLTAYHYDSQDAYLLHHKYVDAGECYGLLPVLSNSGNAFYGWYTDSEGGEQITAESVYTTDVLYARWGCPHTYTAVRIPATCTEYEKFVYTCDLCGDSYTLYADEVYRDWSEFKPEGVEESLIETKTQYRYADYETITSTEADLEGWDQLGSEWVSSGTGTVAHVASWPSGFSTAHSLYSQYNNPVKTSIETDEEKITVNSDRITGYIYWHWCRGTYTAGPINRMIESFYTSEFCAFHAFYSTTDPGTLNQVDGGGHQYANASCCTDTYWYFYTPVYTQTYTTYAKAYTWGRWGAWSGWSDAAYTPNDTRRVEERTLYRYIGKITDWSETYPEGTEESLIRTKTQYRYADQESTTSYEPKLDGYTQIGTSWEADGTGTVAHVASWPSGFSTAHSLYSQYNNPVKTSIETDEEKITVNSDRITGYIYWHWCRGTYTAGPINRMIESFYTSEFCAFHAFYSTTDPSTLNQVDGGGHQYSNASCCTDTYWYFCLPVYTQTYTTYCKLYTYACWGDWSEWSDTVYTASDTRKVETRTLYRTITSELGEHTWNSGVVTTEAACTHDGVKTYTCTVCGDTKTEAIPKAAHDYVDGYCTTCGGVDPDYNFVPVVLTVGDVSGYPGDTVTVPVTIADNEGFAGFTFVIDYDRTALTLTNITKGEVLNASESGAFTKNISGSTVNWVDSQNLTGEGALMTLTFEIAETTAAGSYDVTMDLKGGNATNFVDENSHAVHVNFVSGSVSVEEKNVQIASGYSGALTWSLTDDGVLTFSSEGKMKNYEYKSEMPWYGYLDQITTVVLNDGVTSIGDYAFYGMPNLLSISIPESVTTIGSYAFKNCPVLDGVVLPSQLNTLGESAFYACTGLTSIEIPASLWTVQPYTFKNCTALAEVTFHEGNLMKISDGAFYNTAVTELVLPDCLTILDVYSFKNCAKLESIILSGSLTQIREAVFYGTAIPTIEIPEGVTSIGPYAFKNCTRLVSIDLPSTLTSVGEASFYECTALKSLDLPDAVTKIGNYAFRKCADLRTVTFSDSLVNIGESSFYGCESLFYLDIPENVTTIQGYAFKGCTNLGIVELPNSLQTLGDSAFHTCTGLDEITIPSGVTKIGEYCFSGSAGIDYIYFLGDAPTIGSGAFNKITATAYYPSGNSTWTASVRQNYGGTITWTAQ